MELTQLLLAGRISGHVARRGPVAAGMVSLYLEYVIHVYSSSSKVGHHVFSDTLPGHTN